MTGLRAGYAAVDITPPVGTDLTGFNARSGPCEGTLDALEARALVFEDSAGNSAALITCDLIGLGKHLVARVRRRVLEATGFPEAAQLYNCSHTHAGPETGVLSTIGVPDPAYLAWLEGQLAQVVIRAAHALIPVAFRMGMADVPDGLAINRVYRYQGRREAYDRQLTVLRVERDNGGPLATLVAFACHATALGHSERHAATDYVGPLRRALEAAGTGPVLYVNGCGGDVNPASMDSRGRDAAEALGNGLAAVALRVDLAPVEGLASPASGPHLPLPRGEGKRAPQIFASQELVTLPYHSIRGPDEAAAILAAGRKRLAATSVGTPEYRLARVVEVDYALRLLRLHYGSETLPEVRAEVQALRIGPMAIVGLPGEIFSSIGRAIKDASPFGAPRTIMAGWSNDNAGYVPDHAAYGVASYEADTAARWYGHPAPWAPEAGDLLTDAALRVLRSLMSRER